MMLLVSGANGVFERYFEKHGRGKIGRFINPHRYSGPRTVTPTGCFWAADNDAFHGFHEERFVLMLKRWQHTPGCLFVTAPDVVGDALATTELFHEWASPMRKHGVVRLAYVLQDGCTPDLVPWTEVHALFIGGSDDWKTSPECRALVTRGRRGARAHWIHMGRVNGRQRVHTALGMGVDSIDGSSTSKFPDICIREMLSYIREAEVQRAVQHTFGFDA